MPEDIRKAIPYIFEILKAMNIQVEMVSGFEADDLIGTLSKQAEKKGYKVFMMTPDKDFGQLVSENIFIYKPGRSGNPSEILGSKEVCEKFEVERPEQVIDILGLWGDAVDNIPGIPGIGEKTAKKLIGIYGSIENLLANTGDLKGKQKENVENFADQGLISKKLATIILDCPVEFNESVYKRKEIDEKPLTDILKELEFNQLGKRILGKPIYQEKQMDLFATSDNEAESTRSLQDFSSTKPDYKLIQTMKEHLNFVNELSSKELKRDLLIFAKQQPKLFLNLCEDENVELRNFAIKAVEANIITLADDNRVVKWTSNGRKLMTVPFEENPYSAMAAWLKTDEGIEVYKSIQKKLK